MRVTAGKIATRLKQVPFHQFDKELDMLVGIKTTPRGTRVIDRSAEALLTGETHSWAEIGEAICGMDLIRRLRDRRFGGLRGGRWEATEDAGAGAMGPSQFQAINYWSQAVAKILEAIQLNQYEQPEFIGSEITTLKPGIIQNLGRRPRYSPPTTSAKKSLQPNEPIPMGSMDAEWIDVNPVEKHGQGLAIATETMLFDGNQGAAIEAVGKISYQIGWSKEDRILRPVFGIENTYRYGAAQSSGTSTAYNTYSTTVQDTFASYINSLTANLDSELDLNAIEQVFLAMTDPRTGYPINMGGKRDLIVMPYKIMSARRVCRITTVEQGPRATAPQAVEGTSTTWTSMLNEPKYSQRAMQLLTTADANYSWAGLTTLQAQFRMIYGDPKKAFEYREARPFQTWSWNMTQDPSLALHDCFMMVVAIEQGSTTVIEPRHVVQITNDSDTGPVTG